jgi:hypothetical protein
MENRNTICVAVLGEFLAQALGAREARFRHYQKVVTRGQHAIEDR